MIGLNCMASLDEGERDRGMREICRSFPPLSNSAKHFNLTWILMLCHSDHIVGGNIVLLHLFDFSLTK